MNEIESIKYRIEQGYTMTRYGSHKAMVFQLLSDTKYLLNQVENNGVLDRVSYSFSCGKERVYGENRCEIECNICKKKL